jgi:MFS-type transporter involved in bile tolerance (Atg22 family)
MRTAALATLFVALLLGSWGLWLVATPDYDGGRRPVGAIILAFAILLLFISVAVPRGRRN